MTPEQSRRALASAMARIAEAEGLPPDTYTKASPAPRVEVLPPGDSPQHRFALMSRGR